MPEIFLGFEIGSAKPVHVPFAHTVVCGMTQASGKTTTLEAMLSRTGTPPRPALAFLTKRAESAFVKARRIPPYFRDHADWQFVESILEAMMRERMKYERQWIIRVCQGARTLAQVAANVELALHGDGKHKRAATGFAAGMYLQLSEYFKLLLPELKRLQLDMASNGASLVLEPGMNVMDLSEYSTEMQSLAIASTMEAVYLSRNIITVIPEAWEFLPQARNTPVKLAGEALIRKGAAAQNFMWLDSQDITGVDKRVLKQVGVWILGVQREKNEVEHTLSQMGVPKKLKPQPEAVMQLRRGQFFVCFEDQLKLVYVLPAWMAHNAGKAIAANLISNPDHAEEQINFHIANHQPKAAPMEHQHMDYYAAYQEAVAKISELEKAIAELKRSPSTPQTSPDPPRERREHTPRLSDVERTVEKVAGSTSSQDQVTIALDRESPELDVTVRRFTVKMSDKETIGRLAILIYEKWFDKSRRFQDIGQEFRARGWAQEKTNNKFLTQHLGKLAEMGFLRLVGSLTYQAVEGMKINIREVQTAA